MALIQDRADCATSLTIGALVDPDPNNARPAKVVIENETVKPRPGSTKSRSVKTVKPRRAQPGATLNGKTKARSFPLSHAIAAVLHRWLHESPLKAASGVTWPFAGQPTHDKSTCFFPGCLPSGHRTWHKSVTRQGYLGRLKAVAIPLLEAERAAAQTARTPHIFDGFDFAKLGTHSFKKTGIMALKDVCKSTTVVGAICGTSNKTIERYRKQHGQFTSFRKQGD